MTRTKTSKLYPFYFPIYQKCCDCQGFKFASTMQFLSNRQRYFCLACATAKGMPPSKELLSRLPEAQEAQAKAKATPGQKQKKAKVGSGRK